MSNASIREEPAPYEPWGVLPLTLRVTETFEEFVRLNPDLVVEQKANGDIIVMSPTGAETSDRNAELTFQLRAWSKRFEGITFDSSVLFTLPDGSKRGPDASWIAMHRWEALSKDDRESFAPICPDFVIELRSRSDRLKDLQQKMSDYMANGVRLGWIIDPYQQQAFIYRQNREVEVFDKPATLSGEDVLLGFVLSLSTIWAT